MFDGGGRDATPEAFSCKLEAWEGRWWECRIVTVIGTGVFDGLRSGLPLGGLVTGQIVRVVRARAGVACDLTGQRPLARTLTRFFSANVPLQKG